MVNAYGPTEATVCSSRYHFDAARAGRANTPIGSPGQNMTIDLLDADLHAVPLGVVGELYIGGVGVARGYVNRAGATAGAFVPDPLARTPGARLYRTGDLARRLPGGNLEFVGRRDQQVKVRGFRIELGEIEATLQECAGVRAAAVLAPAGRSGERRLVAYVSGDADEAALRRELRAKLPAHMIPSIFVHLEALPSTRSGKVDRKALPPAEADSCVARAAPGRRWKSGWRACGARCWGGTGWGATDNFFEVGGHSLLATQLVSRLRAELGVELGVRVLFESPRLEDLAARLERAPRIGALVPLVAGARDGSVPASFAQQRMWFLDQHEPGGSAYNVPRWSCAWRGRSTSARSRERGEIACRHESLRTTFGGGGGAPLSGHRRAGAGGDGGGADRAGAPRGDRARRDAAAVRPGTGPLVRARLLRLGAEEHVLLVVMHHIVCDGWSMGVFARELGALYDGRERSPRSGIQYADFASWQRGWLAGGELERQLSYWKGQLAGAPPSLELPTDRPRPAVQRSVGARWSGRLPRELRDGVRALGLAEGRRRSRRCSRRSRCWCGATAERGTWWWGRRSRVGRVRRSRV